MVSEKKGKNDGKDFGVLWESEPQQQRLLPLLETFSLSARGRPQPIPVSAEQPQPGEGPWTLTEGGRGGTSSPHSSSTLPTSGTAFELTAPAESGVCLHLAGESLL